MKIQNNLSRRLRNYAVQIILFSRKWPVDKEFEIIKHQIIKSATSPGANYEEAQAAGTRPDFHNKINISLKEIRESIYWLRIIDDLNNSEISKTSLKEITNEAEKLAKILGSISKKTKRT